MHLNLATKGTVFIPFRLACQLPRSLPSPNQTLDQRQAKLNTIWASPMPGHALLPIPKGRNLLSLQYQVGIRSLPTILGRWSFIDGS